MKGFLVGLIVAMVAAVGGYYYFFIQEAEVQKSRQESVAAHIQVEATRIPAEAVMEDGTLPE